MLYDIHIRLQFDGEVTEEVIKEIAKGAVGSTLVGPSECVYCNYYVLEDTNDYVIVPRFKVARRNLEKIKQIHVRHISCDQNSKIKSSNMLKYEAIEPANRVLFDPR